MKNVLKDIVHYTTGIVNSPIKIVGSESETSLVAAYAEKGVYLIGTVKTAIPEFTGTFGLPNVERLKIILAFEDWDDNSQTTVIRELKEGIEVPTTIHFETKNSDFVTDYRLMAQYQVEQQVPSIKTLKALSWDVTFDPTVNGIQRLKRQSSAAGQDDTFTAETVNGNLKLSIGNHAEGITGNFIFHTGLTGTLKGKSSWSIKSFLSIMDLAGAKTISICEHAMKVTVDSGIANYTYILRPLGAKTQKKA